MLPFLQPRKISGLIMSKVKPDGKEEIQAKEDEMDPGLIAAAEDLISAVHSKDATRVASALKAAMEMCGMGESMPESSEPA